MRYLLGTALAATLLLAVNGTSRANDVVRLGGPSAEANISGGTNDELVHWGRGGYRGGYYGRGYYGGHYGRGYYGGYYGRSYYGGYYRPYAYGSYYQPYYYGSYYQPYYNGYSGYGCYCGTPSYSYVSPYYAVNSAPASVIQTNVYAQTIGRNSELLPVPYSQLNKPRASELLSPPVFNDNKTYPYDGGPSNPIPIPSENPVPLKGAPRPMIPLEGKIATLPKETSGGFSPVVTPEIQKLRYVSLVSTAPAAQLTPAPARIAYPAYGEQPITPAPRKTGTR